MFSRNYSRPILDDCTFEGNLAEDGPGGGMSNYTMSSPTLIDCTFSNNFSTDHSGNGGGMSNSQAASPTLLNCTFTGNAAVGSSSSGGGMFSTGEGSMELYDCTFIDNHATDSGGGMVLASAPNARVPDQLNQVAGADDPGLAARPIDGSSQATGPADFPVFAEPSLEFGFRRPGE